MTIKAYPLVMSSIASFVAMGMVSSVRADLEFPFSSWASSSTIRVSSGRSSAG